MLSSCATPENAGVAQGGAVYGNETDDLCFYERVVEMDNGNLLATWCREFPVVSGWTGMKSYYFYTSTDDGATWSQISTLDPSSCESLSGDKMGMHGLYVFPQNLGDFPAGTILFATSDWSRESQYCIHIWRSTDNGLTWEKHGDLAPRSESIGSVWEPEFAVSADGRLVCYYSDERHPNYDQRLALEISSDGGVTWSDYSIIVGSPESDWIRGKDPSLWRPGMPRVTRLSNGLYFMAYENIAAGYDGIISCRVSEDGIHWGDPEELGTVVNADHSSAYQCPAIACMDDGSTYGRLFLRGMNDNCSPNQCFTSTDGGETWSLIEAPLTAVRNESVGSGWSGDFLVKGNRLIELGNAYNGSYNEIRCGFGIVRGGELIIPGEEYAIVNTETGLRLESSGWQIRYVPDDLLLTKPDSEYHGWKLVDAGDGNFRIQNPRAGRYLTAENSESEDLRQCCYLENDTQKWKLERICDITMFRSSNYPTCYIYHDVFRMTLISNNTTHMPLESSQWRVVPGLADSACISIESVDKPGYYLRHYQGCVKISENDGSTEFVQDATWRIHDALDGLGGISMESYNIPNTYIRHYNSYLRISQISTVLDRSDASFRLITQ
jgi:hypothetical protein